MILPGTKPSSDDIVLISDPRIAAIPLADIGESLVDLRQDSAFLVDASREGVQKISPSISHLRQGVADLLKKAQALLPNEVRFLIKECHRPLSVQASLYEEYFDKLQDLHPDWSIEQTHSETSKFVAPPAVAPHSTGGAVDLTLVSLSGEKLDLGTPIIASPEETDGLTFTYADGLSEAARDNRQMLVDCLTEVGLVNYPTEWWHWSYGDQYWAFMTGTNSTLYSPIEV